MVSQSNKMTIFTFEEDYIIGSFFLIQDYYNVQKLSEVKGITCWSQSSCPVTLNAANGPVSAMTLNYDDGDEFIKRLDLSPDAVLKIYIGARREDDESNVIVSYDLQQSHTSIPQKFNGEIMTYYLENGTALVELAEDSNYTRWNDATVGREGFITSRQLGSLTDSQEVHETIGGLDSNQTFLFRINVTYVDISNDAELTVTFGTGEEIKKYKFSNEISQQSNSFSEISSNMTVTYSTNGTITRGFYLDFKIEAAMASSSYASTFLVFLTMLILLM